MQESMEASLVRILTASGQVVGAGFLVGEREVLTCAHVVAGALGLADDTPEKPQALVSLDFPRVAPGQLLTAHVVLWRPPRADGGDDLAGLELVGAPPSGAQPAPLAQVEDLWEHSFRAFGFPRGQDTGVWATGRLLGRQVTNWVQIEDVKETGFAVEPGFSGTPVWDSQVDAVVGMIVAAEKRMNLKTAFAIPVDVLAGSWPLLESRIYPFVFVCYARADSERVIALKTDLQGQGISVWIDREGLQPGTLDWEEALRTAIRAARAVLLIASPNARGSRYVRDELRIAELYQRPVYPLWIAGTHWMDAVPLGWGGAQYIDARESHYETAIPELVGVLNTATSTPAKVSEPDFEPRNPYKGLRAFNSDDAPDFFGRDALINALATALEGALASEEKNRQCVRLLTVIGPSGSGKSSVVMAGLLPRLREGRLPGSEQWVYLNPIVPGTRPLEALTLALSEHLPDKSLKAIREDLEDDSARGLHLLATKLAKRAGTKVVLLVDQFEELFTQTPSEDERRHFLELLVTASTEPHSPVIVLLTLRADFYDRPMRYPELGQLIDRHHQPVFPMKIDELRATIEQPAALPDVRLTFEGDLVGDLLFEVQGQVGALPLLQFTLDQLFGRHSGRQLTLSAYRELGGVKGALTRKAEETYAALPSEEHRKMARALFVRLIDPGVTEQDTTRRRAALSEFSLPQESQTRLLREVADAFIAARLLTTNEIAGTTTIEVSHEALIREWPRLAGWLREAREDIRLQQTISEDSAGWELHNKSGDRLYRGSQLKEARAWAMRNTPSGNEMAFLRASAAQRVRSVASVIVVVLLLLSTTGVAGWFLSRPSQTYVTTLNDDGPGSLRRAIADAKSGDTITFDEKLGGKTIMLTSDDLGIYKNLRIRGPGADPLTISSGSSGHIVHIRSGSSVTISGLTFKNSQTGENSFITNDGTLMLTDSMITGNTATPRNWSFDTGDAGGGINNSGTLTLLHCMVTDNNDGDRSFDTAGGGINNSGALTLINSTVSGNKASFWGGGINNASLGKVTLINSTVSGNTLSQKYPNSPELPGGGGIYNIGALTLTNSTVSANTVSIGKLDRSGLLPDSTFIEGGGGIYSNTALTLTNSTVSDNSVSGEDQRGDVIYGGGGIYLSPDYSSPNAKNKILSARITFSTIYDNTAHDGGGIYVDGTTNPMEMKSSIIAGNSAHSNPDIAGRLTSLGYNLIGNRSGATFLGSPEMQSTDVLGVSSTNLKIDPVLRDNGGSTKPHSLTHALLPGSPAIDAIPLQYCQIKVIFNRQSRMYTDQRGMKRPGDDKNKCDIGAFESQTHPPDLLRKGSA